MAERTQRIIAIGTNQSSTAIHGSNRNVLALDIRAQKLGFVMFEEQTKLLAFGTQRYGGTRRRLVNAALKRVALLLDLYEPSALVIRKIHVHSPEVSQQLREVTKIVCNEARRRSIRVQIFSADTVKRFFAESGLKTKHEIACTLAEWYKEIAWKLPTKKKAWQSERHNSVIFDAVATGVAFFGLKDSIRK